MRITYVNRRYKTRDTSLICLNNNKTHKNKY